MRGLKRSLMLISVLAALLLIAGGMLTAQTDGVAFFRFVHGIPDAPAVDVYTDGQLTVSNLAFGAASTYAQIPSGARQLIVTASGSADPLWEQSVEAGRGLSYTLVAVGTDPLAFAVYEEDRNPTQFGAARFTAVHAVPNADALDVVLADGRAVIPNFAFGQPSSSIDLPVSFVYDILLVPTGAAPDDALLTPDALALTTNTSYMLVVYGSEDEPQAELLEAPVFATEASGFLRLAHGIADAPAVNVALNGTVIVSELSFGEVTPHIPVAVGNYDVTFTAADSGEEVLSGSLIVEGGAAYTGVVIEGNDEPLWAVFSDDLSALSDDQALISVINTLPDGQFATVTLEDGTTLSESLGSAQISEAVAIDPAELSGLLTIDLETASLEAELPLQSFYGGVYYNAFVINRDGQPALIFAPTSLLQGPASAPGASDAELIVSEPQPTEDLSSSEVVMSTTEAPEVAQAATPMPLPPSATPTLSVPLGPTARVVLDPGANLQLRQYPSTGAFSLGLVPSGSTLIVNGRAGAPIEGSPPATPTDFVDPVTELTDNQDLNPADTWLNITYNPPGGGSITAWVNAQFLDVRDDRGRRQRLADLPTIPSNRAGVAIDTDVTPPPIAENRVTATVFGLEPGVNLHVRRTPNPAAESLVLLPNGTAVELLGLNEDQSWAFVSFTSPQGGTVTGWVSTEFLNFNLNGSAVTIDELETRNLLITIPADRRGEVSGTVGAAVSSSGDPLKDAFIAVVNVDPGANLHLRRDPSTSAESLALIPGGTRLVITARDGDGQWLQTTFENRVGWVSSLYVTLTFNGRPAEIVDIPLLEGETNTLPESTLEPTPIGGIVDVTVLAVIEINVDAVPMTGSPGGSSEGLPVLPRGTRAYLISVSGPDNNYSYIQVVENHVRGWIINGTYMIISTPAAPTAVSTP